MLSGMLSGRENRMESHCPNILCFGTTARMASVHHSASGKNQDVPFQGSDCYVVGTSTK